METKHTPGPWEITRKDFEDDFPEVYVRVPEKGPASFSGGRYICHVFNQLTAEDDANAKLISAAPDLLAACEMVLNASEWDGEDFSASEIVNAIDWKQLADAIAKAKGE